MKNFILLGPPGSGKGTLAERVSAKYGIPQISTGRLLRENIVDGTELGKKAAQYIEKGDLVPDELVVGLVFAELSTHAHPIGFMLDGFPRTIAQAEILEEMLAKLGDEIEAVVHIDVDREELIGRIAGREVCSDCGKTYHSTNFPTKVPGICDLCGAPTFHRADDNPEAVGNRIDVYIEQTMPIIGYYDAMGLLYEFDGMRGPDAVLADMEKLINA
jgi:adenylate kinase